MNKLSLEEIEQLEFRPETIVCPVEFVDDERAGLESAAALAARVDARLHVIHVLNAPPPAPVEVGQRMLPDLEEQWKAAREAAKGKLERLIIDVTRELDVDAVQEILLGVDYKEIVHYASDVDADLIVMEAHGRRKLPEKLIGSVAERVIRLAVCPVLTVPPADGGFEPRHALIATDLSPYSDLALPLARFLAHDTEATVSLAHVLPPRAKPGMMSETGPPPTMTEGYWEQLRESAEQDLEERADRIGGDSPIEHAIVESGDPGAEIVDLADRKDVDLIVVGTHGHSGLTRLLLGSTAEKIVREADCAVLTVTPDYFEDKDRGSAAA
jgi:nucleotide-binding universal stress UspA family protein